MGLFDSLLNPPPEMTQEFRTKLGFLLLDSFGRYIPLRTVGPYCVGYVDRVDEEPISNQRWRALCDAMRRKFGRQKIAPGECEAEECLNFLLRGTEQEIIAVLEQSIHLLTAFTATAIQNSRVDVRLSNYETTSRLNLLFDEHSLPFQWSEGRIESTDRDQHVLKPMPVSQKSTKQAQVTPVNSETSAVSPAIDGGFGIHGFVVFCSLIGASCLSYFVFRLNWLSTEIAGHLKFWIQFLTTLVVWLLFAAISDKQHARQWIIGGVVTAIVGVCQIASQAHPENAPLKEAQSQSHLN